MSTRGIHLSELSAHLEVIRLADPSKQLSFEGRISPLSICEEEFILTTDDKSTDPPHLSVWESSLTKAEEAYAFLDSNSPKKLAILLSVGEICQLVGCAGEEKFENLLSVRWTHLEILHPDEPELLDKDGALGHAGVIGLMPKVPQLTNKQLKLLRRDLRVQLAELASKKNWPV